MIAEMREAGVPVVDSLVAALALAHNTIENQATSEKTLQPVLTELQLKY